MGSSSTKALNPEAEKFVQDTIASDRVVIFSKSYCPYCSTAKKQFQNLNVDYLAIELEKRPDCSDIQDVLGQLTGARSVPRVFINGNFIGGGDDVKRLYGTGELAKMLS